MAGMATICPRSNSSRRTLCPPLKSSAPASESSAAARPASCCRTCWPQAGIDNVVVEKRDHETIRTTHRAGILEHGSVDMLVDSGVSDRVLKAGYKHEGIDLRFGGESHRIDFDDLVGEAVWLYPQNEVFVDLAAARERDGGEVHYSVSDTEVLGPDHRHPEDPVHRHGRQRRRKSTPRSWSAPTGPAGSANGRSRRNTAPTTSSSTRSPGSASSARRRPARRN